MVSTGRRWYLVAYDIDRADWRTFRVDRVEEPFATGARFTQRELPTGDAAEYLRRSMSGRGRPSYDLDVTFQAPVEFVAARLPSTLGVPVAQPDGTCRLRATAADSVEWLALRLALVDCEFTAHGPDELVSYIRELGARLDRATSSGPSGV